MTGAADEPSPYGADKRDAEAFALRARPRPAARLRRTLLIGAVAVGALGLSVLAWLALSPRIGRVAVVQASPSTGPQASSDALARLPRDYGQVELAPKLGPPLPGDLGRAILDQRRQTGAVVEARPVDAAQSVQAARDRRLAAIRQARESGLIALSPNSGARSGEGEGGKSSATITLAEPERVATDGASKQSFLQTLSRDAVRNSHVIEAPVSPYVVMAGDIIAASLLTGLNSDLPGFVTAQVTENVYDSATGHYLLIPQGARLVGGYDSGIAFGQRRALVVWRRLIFPDGASIQLDNLPATDAAGYAGLADEVDFHTWGLLKAVGMSTLLGVGSELAMDDDSDLVRALRRSGQEAGSEAGRQLVGKRLDVQPTIKVRPGWPLRVIVHKDLVLRPWKGL